MQTFPISDLQWLGLRGLPFQVLASAGIIKKSHLSSSSAHLFVSTDFSIQIKAMGPGSPKKAVSAKVYNRVVFFRDRFALLRIFWGVRGWGDLWARALLKISNKYELCPLALKFS